MEKPNKIMEKSVRLMALALFVFEGCGPVHYKRESSGCPSTNDSNTGNCLTSTPPKKPKLPQTHKVLDSDDPKNVGESSETSSTGK